MIVKLMEWNIDDACVLIEEFTENSHYKDIRVDFNHVRNICHMAVEHGVSYIAYADGKPVGILLALLSPMWINPSILTSTELAWWVSPSYRGIGIKLLKHYEQAAKDAGVKYISMVSMDTSGTENLMKRCGYVQREQSWVKEI